MTTKNDEKRKYHRLDANCEVSFAVGPESDKKKRIYFTVPAKNLSVQGLAFEFNKELPLGTFLHVKLNFLARKTTVKVRGEVQRCTKAHHAHDAVLSFVVGVKFLGSPDNLGNVFIHCMRPAAA